MHLESHEIGDLERFLKQCAHVVQVRQERRRVVVALTAVRRIAIEVHRLAGAGQ